MAPDIASRSETRGQIIRLARLAILGTLFLAALLLAADFVGRGWSNDELRFLSGNVLTTIVYGIAIEAVAAIAALTCLALWKE
jgi:hypothetical protein